MHTASERGHRSSTSGHSTEKTQRLPHENLSFTTTSLYCLAVKNNIVWKRAWTYMRTVPKMQLNASDAVSSVPGLHLHFQPSTFSALD